MEENGIIMFNCGTDKIIGAIVALYSLRKFYNGPITFYVEDPCLSTFEQTLKYFNCEVVHLPESKKSPLIKKTELFADPPYNKTLWLDSDIVVVDKIDEMFDALNEVDVCIPHFCNKYTNSVKENLCSSRIKKFQGVVDDGFLQEALDNHPSINTGVISFKKSAEWKTFVGDWINLANKGVEIKAFVPDESSFQLLYPSIDRWRLKIKIVSSDYNIYALDSDTHEDPKIYHFAGNKSCISDIPNCNIWKNMFEEMRKDNIADINLFLPYANKRIKEYLNGGNVFCKKADKKADKKEIITNQNIKYTETITTTPQNCLLEGLVKAKDDTKILQDTSFNKNFGPSLYNQYFEHFPMFFNRFGSEIDLIGQYHGASIFFICNGPSLVSGKYDLTNLKRPGVMTYGINNGARTIRPNFWTCIDDPARFLFSIWNDPCITKIVPFSFSEKSIFENKKWKTSDKKVQDCPNIVYFRRNEKFVANRFLNELTFNWGNHKDHGGGRSVMLAALKAMFLLGFRNVFLMGADFKMSESYTYHFDEQRSKGAVNGNTDTYNKLMHQYFPELKPYFEAEGFHVYNCNPDSELKVFDYVPFEEAISFATSSLGEVENERTWGMYSKPDERQKWAIEPDDRNKAHLNNISNRMKTPVFMDNGTKIENVATAEQSPNLPSSMPMCIKNKISNSPVSKQHTEPKFSNPQKNINKQPQLTQKNRIIRSVPCGGGISFGSSGAGQHNISIEDNGR